MRDPDRDIVKKAQKGDKSAFSELVNHYYEMVYALAMGILHNRESAKDLTQDVFVKVYGNINKFKGQSKFKTWLYRVAVNQALDQTRKKRPTESLDITEDEGVKPHVPVANPAAGPRDEAARQELKVVFRQALAELSPEHRAILVLREWQELSYEEIAETLNLELGTVMSRIHYARKKLAEVLEKRSDLHLSL